MSSPDLFLITVTLTPICTISNQLAVPVCLRLKYGEKDEGETLPWGKSKSGPSLARSIPFINISKSYHSFLLAAFGDK